MEVDGIELFLNHGRGISRSDAAMIKRAVKNNWPIPEDKKELLMNRMCDIALSSQSSERNAIGATKAILTADSINAKREGLDIAEAKPAASTTVNIDNRKQVILRIPDNGRGNAIEHG